jgi:hypothetical protein
MDGQSARRFVMLPSGLIILLTATLAGARADTTPSVEVEDSAGDLQFSSNNVNGPYPDVDSEQNAQFDILRTWLGPANGTSLEGGMTMAGSTPALARSFRYYAHFLVAGEHLLAVSRGNSSCEGLGLFMPTSIENLGKPVACIPGGLQGATVSYSLPSDLVGINGSIVRTGEVKGFRASTWGYLVYQTGLVVKYYDNAPNDGFGPPYKLPALIAGNKSAPISPDAPPSKASAPNPAVAFVVLAILCPIIQPRAFQHRR